MQRNASSASPCEPKGTRFEVEGPGSTSPLAPVTSRGWHLEAVWRPSSLALDVQDANLSFNAHSTLLHEARSIALSRVEVRENAETCLHPSGEFYINKPSSSLS